MAFVNEKFDLFFLEVLIHLNLLKKYTLIEKKYLLQIGEQEIFQYNKLKKTEVRRNLSIDNFEKE